MFVSVWIFCLVSGLLAEGELDQKKALNENFQADTGTEFAEFLQSIKEDRKKDIDAMEEKIMTTVNSIKSKQIRCVSGGKRWDEHEDTTATFKFDPKFKKRPSHIVALRGFYGESTAWVNYDLTESEIKMWKSTYDKHSFMYVEFLACGV